MEICYFFLKKRSLNYFLPLITLRLRNKVPKSIGITTTGPCTDISLKVTSLQTSFVKVLITPYFKDMLIFNMNILGDRFEKQPDPRDLNIGYGLATILN